MSLPFVAARTSGVALQWRVGSWWLPHRNASGFDRAIRIAFAVVLSLATTDGWLGVLAIVVFATGLYGFSPIYRLARVRTFPTVRCDSDVEIQHHVEVSDRAMRRVRSWAPARRETHPRFRRRPTRGARMAGARGLRDRR